MAKIRIIKHDGGILDYEGNNEVIKTYEQSFEAYKNADGPNILQINFLDRAQNPDLISMNLIKEMLFQYDEESS